MTFEGTFTALVTPFHSDESTSVRIMTSKPTQRSVVSIEFAAERPGGASAICAGRHLLLVLLRHSPGRDEWQAIAHAVERTIAERRPRSALIDARWLTGPTDPCLWERDSSDGERHVRDGERSA